MAGIYLHIPFCMKKCNYCDFYSNSNFGIVPDILKAEKNELELRHKYLKNENIDTIYFGGGTPSILNHEQIENLLKAIYKNFSVNDGCEITFECNPDDLKNGYLSALKSLGINRISIGVQSFNDEALKFLGRRHTAEQAKNAIIGSLQEGFTNISIDLIFGIPGVSFENYKMSLQQAINLGVPHISAYQLTIEEKSILYKRLINNIIHQNTEEEIIEQFEYTMNFLKTQGFQQYEVSNYARDGFMSRHNWLYWSNGHYIGVGPSAHSYNGESRQWNISNNPEYIKRIEEKDSYFTVEQLSEIDQFNEYLLTGLRTSKGVSLDYIKQFFGERLASHFIRKITGFVDGSLIKRIGNNFSVSIKGITILDFMLKELIYI
jgi:oxygen-independent coproporphyrinogen III oxidase